MKQQQFFKKPERFLRAFIFILCLTGFTVQTYAIDWPGSTGQTTWTQLETFIKSSNVSVGDIIELTEAPTHISSKITINKSVTLRSKTGNLVLIKTGQDRHINIEGINTTLTLENITLDSNGEGGGIVSNTMNATLNLNSGAVIQNCYDGAQGGGVYLSGTNPTVNVNGGVVRNNTVDPNSPFFNGQGGGIWCSGTLTITGGEISGNSAKLGGGIYAANIDMKNGTIQGNYADNDGGGIFQFGASGVCKITGGTIGGGRTFNGDEITAAKGVNDAIGNYCNTPNGGGGGIYTQGTLTVSNGVIKGNRSNNRGGGIYHNNGNTVTLTNVTISGNSSTDSGGGVYLNVPDATLNITNGIINGNSSDYGGGICSLGAIIINADAIISGNTAASYGGGISAADIYMENGTIQGNYAGIDGGGIYQNSSNGVCEITGGIIGGGRTFNGDEITAAQGINSPIGNYCKSDSGGGGGIYAAGAITVSNSDIKGNRSNGYGGGIYSESTVTMNSGLISGNMANEEGGGIYLTAADAFNALTVAADVIFADNKANNPYWLELENPENADYKAPLTVQDYIDFHTAPLNNIQTTTRSNPPAGNYPFTYLINNYDINFVGTITENLTSVCVGETYKLSGTLENAEELTAEWVSDNMEAVVPQPTVSLENGEWIWNWAYQPVPEDAGKTLQVHFTTNGDYLCEAAEVTVKFIVTFCDCETPAQIEIVQQGIHIKR